LGTDDKRGDRNTGTAVYQLAQYRSLVDLTFRDDLRI
jgi:hypothetical protein